MRSPGLSKWISQFNVPLIHLLILALYVYCCMCIMCIICVYLPSYLLPFSFLIFFIHFLTYLLPSRIGPFHFQAGHHRTKCDSRLLCLYCVIVSDALLIVLL